MAWCRAPAMPVAERCLTSSTSSCGRLHPGLRGSDQQAAQTERRTLVRLMVTTCPRHPAPAAVWTPANRGSIRRRKLVPLRPAQPAYSPRHVRKSILCNGIQRPQTGRFEHEGPCNSFTNRGQMKSRRHFYYSSSRFGTNLIHCKSPNSLLRHEPCPPARAGCGR